MIRIRLVVSRVFSSESLSGLRLFKLVAISWSLLAIVVSWNATAFAQSSSDSAGATFSAQPGEVPPAPGIRGQPEDDRTLEIAPQTGLTPPDKGVSEVPSEKAYKPGENAASLDRNFNPGGSDRGGKHRKLPYLGISVQYTLKCYLGQEEHGLEIVNVDPNSPAWKSGLQASKPPGAAGVAAATAGALLGPLNLLVLPLMARAGQLGKDGDLIVAVDDHRVRSQLDLEDELAKLKPGDTMYLTVIRPLPGGAHKTMKIAVKVGEPGENLAAAGSPGATAPSSSDAEEYAY
jgi:PDZ domain-containing protein